MNNVPAPPIEEETEAYDVTSEVLNEVLDAVTNNTKPPNKNAVKLLVGSIFWDGFWAFHVTPETKIHRIKMLVLLELFGNEFDGLSGNYALSFPQRRKCLNDTKNVKDEHLESDDELEMIKLPSNEDISFRATFENFEHHISDAAINKYTAHLDPPREKPKTCNVILEIQGPECEEKYYRRIFLSTMKWLANILFGDQTREELNSQLVLPINEWLEETRSIESNILGIPTSFHVDDTMTPETELQELLVLFHQYLRASFKLSPQALEHLVELGFNEEESKKALRYTGNSIQESVEYLIGNTDLANDGAKPGLDTGMSKTCDMYKHIMKEEEIILPLSTPSVLYACLSVMDGNAFLVSSIRFPALMNTLNKILSIYYVNKCDMAMKQMLGQRPND